MTTPVHIPVQPTSGLEPSPTLPSPTWRSQSGWIIACLALLLLMALSAYRQGVFTPSSHVYIELQAAAGVNPGTPVRLRGFQVGEVDAVELQSDLTVRARLRIETARLNLLSSDTVAKVGRDTPVANKHIDLYPNLKEKTRLSAGKTLVLESGQELEDMLLTAKKTLDQINSTLSKIDPILTDVGAITQQAVQAMPGLRQQAQQVARNVESTTANVRQSSAHANALIEDIAAQRGQLLGDLQEVLGQARQSSVQVNLLLSELNQNIPPAIRAGRNVAEDAAVMSDGLRHSWPFSTILQVQVDAPPRLDSFEASPP